MGTLGNCKSFCSICILYFTITVFAFNEEDYKLKYEYKYSFKGPSLAQPGEGVPFWNHTFDAVPGEDQVRVVPSLRGKRGAVWSKFPFPHEEWKVEISVRIHGRGRIGADGFVLWYVESPNQDGPVFGSMDFWKGMGIFFDSFDNDAQKNNPYIYVIINDGTMSYSHHTDGLEQMKGGCLRDFRNRPYPFKARIVYAKQVLQLYVDSGNSPTEDYELCTEIQNIVLPKDYFFGVSAATGGLADDHDVLKFLTWSLQRKSPSDEPEVVDEEAKKQEEERKRVQEEYEKNLQEFYSEQQRFREEHPDKAKKEEAKPDDLYQGGSSSELVAVFEVQSQIKKQISELSSSVVMVMEKQDRIVSKMESHQPPDVSLAKSHEVENVVKIQRTTYDSIVELQNQINFIKATALTLSDNVAQLGSSANVGKQDQGIASKQYENYKQMNTIQDRLEVVYQSLLDLEKKQRNPPKLVCPEPDLPPCVPLAGLIIVAIIQIVILIAYHSMKQSREDAAKKFF